jgi:ATP-dependent helicase/nuclease subunit A
VSEHDAAAVAAADPRRSAWVSANAGAGKTHALANRVTRLLLEGARPERILCLTYTKSAAAEMQARLFGQLGAWSMLEDGKLRIAIGAIGAPAPDADGLKRARRLFALALETPGGLKIQTIHSFCQYLLSRFPIEAEIPPGFRVLDSQTSRDLIAEARTEILERAGSGERQLADAAAYLVTETSEARLRQILDAALGGDRRKLERFFSEFPEQGHALMQAIAFSHGARVNETVEQIAEQFCAESRAQRGRIEETIEWLSQGAKKDKECAEHLRAFLARDCSPDAFRTLRSAFCTKDGEPKESMATKAMRSAAPGLFEYISAMAERYVAAEQRCRAARAAQLAQAALTLADAVRRTYTEMKRARAALDYSDLITRTLHLLKKSNAAAWVLYKLDGGVDHILIDEAQDTSPEQWEIVQRLTEEFFAGEGTRDVFGNRPTIFAVGDEKQSIFSFQGADPSAFAANRCHFAERAGMEFADVTLATSRRSAPEILAFVDAVFVDPEARDGLTTDGAPIRHEVFRTSAKGRVEFWPAIKQPQTPEPDPWRPVDVESEASPVVQLAEKIAAHIRSWLDRRVCLPGHENPVRPGDIMILVPRREPFASEIIRRLIERGVPVAGADRIRLKNEIAVMDLMALGRFVLLPEDDLNLAALLRSPMIDISEEELFALSAHRKSSLWRELSDRRQEATSFGFAHDVLTEMLARADFLPPYEFFAHTLVARGMRSRFLSRLGEEAGDAIDEFLSLTLEYEGIAPPSLEGFLHWIERGDAEIKRDMERGRDEVRVMTVHGAKGLEADIVILPDTTTLPDPPGRRGELLYGENSVVFPIRNPDASAAVLAAKEAAKSQVMKEYRRLLYVALTRAREQLYICGFENKNGIRDGSWYRLAERAAQSIGRKVPRGDGFIYVVGEEQEDSVAPIGPATPTRIELPDWVRGMPPAECERPRLVRPSDDALVDEPATFSPAGQLSGRFRRGILAHTLLARLPDLAPEERAAISITFLDSQGSSPDDARMLTDETLRVLNDPEFAGAFAPGSRAEVGLIADIPELGEGARVSGRIDRLAITDAEILAVDFKTNRPSPKRLEDVPSPYLRQMALYRLALAKLFPDKRIACALVWTDGPRLMRLPEALLDREIAGLRLRLDAAQ